MHLEINLFKATKRSAAVSSLSLEDVEGLFFSDLAFARNIVIQHINARQPLLQTILSSHVGYVAVLITKLVLLLTNISPKPNSWVLFDGDLYKSNL
jgi:hypothetical protein